MCVFLVIVIISKKLMNLPHIRYRPVSSEIFQSNSRISHVDRELHLSAIKLLLWGEDLDVTVRPGGYENVGSLLCEIEYWDATGHDEKVARINWNDWP